MKKSFAVAGFIMLFGALALSAPIYTRILNLNVSGLTLLGTTNDRNAIANSVVADIDWDFASSTIVCTDSVAIAAAGVNKGDPCFVGYGPRDGGTQVVTANSIFAAYSDADDTVKLRHCAVGSAANPADAGYIVRCFSGPGQ